MSRIIKHREYHAGNKYYLFYETYPSGGGYSFECDENGNILPLNECASVNYEKAIRSGIAPVIQKSTWRYTDPAVIECDCGYEVELFGFTNTCDQCYADYNMSGQLLAPRCQWGEETGEHLCDILGADSYEFDD